MSPEQRDAMGSRGKQAAKDYYTYHRIAEQFAELFAEG
jgi:hypothetical protein